MRSDRLRLVKREPIINYTNDELDEDETDDD